MQLKTGRNSRNEKVTVSLVRNRNFRRFYFPSLFLGHSNGNPGSNFGGDGFWWRWRDSNPRPSDYDSLKNLLLLLDVFLLSFIYKDSTMIYFALLSSILFSHWSKIGAKQSDLFPKCAEFVCHRFFSFGFFGGSIPVCAGNPQNLRD